MSLLNGLHGTVAAALLSVLLFVDEAGVPLPFAPNEVLLLVAGLLIAGGTLSPWEFLPLAVPAMIAGLLTGYYWARAIGSARLRGFAQRLGAEAAYDRAAERIRSASPLRIAITRLLPGVRVYATLVAGAAEVPLRRFLLGAIPAILVWVGICTVLGALVGIPVEHVLTRVEKLAATGVLLLLAGGGAYLAVRHVQPAPERTPLERVPVPGKIAAAIAVDVGIVSTCAAGADRIGRAVVRAVGTGGLSSFNDVVILVGSVAVAYVVLSRRTTGTTAGEGLIGVSYLRRRRPAGT